MADQLERLRLRSLVAVRNVRSKHQAAHAPRMKSPIKTTPTSAAHARDPSTAHEQIAQIAYALWEREGRPHGRAVVHWLQAMAQLERSESVGSAKEKPRAGLGRKLGLIEIAPAGKPAPAESCRL